MSGQTGEATGGQTGSESAGGDRENSWLLTLDGSSSDVRKTVIEGCMHM